MRESERASRGSRAYVRVHVEDTAVVNVAAEALLAHKVARELAGFGPREAHDLAFVRRDDLAQLLDGVGGVDLARQRARSVAAVIELAARDGLATRAREQQQIEHRPQQHRQCEDQDEDAERDACDAEAREAVLELGHDQARFSAFSGCSRCLRHGLLCCC